MNLVSRLTEAKGPTLRILHDYGPYAVAIYDNFWHKWVDWEVANEFQLPYALRKFEKKYDIRGGRYTFYLITIRRLNPDEVRELGSARAPLSTLRRKYI